MKNWAILTVIFSFFLSSHLIAQTNGRNVKLVAYVGGKFEQTGDRFWTEFASENREFTFEELMRDDWSVYLLDRPRDISIQLDLYKKQIYIFYDRPNRALLYPITSTSRFTGGQKKNLKIKGPKGYTKAANEYETKFFKKSVDIAYGANGKYTYRNNVSGSVTFDNATFGDPAPGMPKAGFIKGRGSTKIIQTDSGPVGYTKIAEEYESYTFTETVDVAFGANGKYVFRNNVTGLVTFNNAEFGDPIPRVAKAGYYKRSKIQIAEVLEDGGENPISEADMDLIMKWIADEVADAKISYCWKDSYTRGVGETLSACPPGTVQDGLLCYEPCRAGFSGGGPVCWQNCPSGFRNDPAHCGKPGTEYGRGTGYPWKFGDALNLDAAMVRCLKENPQGCEKSGEIIYPKCKAGFTPVGCCICSPKCPKGMTDIGVSCEKGSYGRGVGTPMICPEGSEQNGALCYEPCKPGYIGVGPVCWKKCPDNQSVDCGMACASSTADCVNQTVDQVLSVGEVALNIASMGSTTGFTAAKAGVKTAIKTGNKVAAKAAMKKAVKELAQGFQELTTKKVVKKLKEKFKEDSIEWVKESYAEVQMQLIMGEEFTPDDLRILAGLDPTGVASVVESFAHPVCAKPNPFPTLSKDYK